MSSFECVLLWGFSKRTCRSVQGNLICRVAQEPNRHRRNRFPEIWAQNLEFGIGALTRRSLRCSFLDAQTNDPSFALTNNKRGGPNTEISPAIAKINSQKIYGCTICPETITEIIRFQFRRCKNYVTAPEINSSGGPICQKIRYGNHSNPL